MLVVWFVAQKPLVGSLQSSSLSSTQAADSINPLDVLSTADIAVHVALMTDLAESTSVVNQADSVNNQLTLAPIDDKIQPKPQIVNTTAKTKNDIFSYTTMAGDTVSQLAERFAVSSDSIRWSNDITGNILAAGKKLWISPVSDGIVYEVKSGDTPQSLADKFQSNRELIISFNDAEVSGLVVGQRIIIPGGQIRPVVAAATFNWFGFSAIYSSNGYDYGWCTWYVANRRQEMGRPVPSNLGNAYSWYDRARSLGLPTGSLPLVGAVAVNTAGNHVSVVEAVNPDGSFWVSEMNSSGQRSMSDSTPYGGWNRVNYKSYAAPGSLRFIY